METDWCLRAGHLQSTAPSSGLSLPDSPSISGQCQRGSPSPSSTPSLYPQTWRSSWRLSSMNCATGHPSQETRLSSFLFSFPKVINLVTYVNLLNSYRICPLSPITTAFQFRGDICCECPEAPRTLPPLPLILRFFLPDAFSLLGYLIKPTPISPDSAWLLLCVPITCTSDGTPLFHSGLSRIPSLSF